MLLDNELFGFLVFKKEQGISVETIHKYEIILKDFIIYLKTKNIRDFFSVNKMDMLDFMKEKMGYSESIYTKKILINTVKMFMRYFYEQSGFKNLYNNFETVKVVTPEISPNIYNANTILKIQNIIDDHMEITEKYKNNAALMFKKEEGKKDDEVFSLLFSEEKNKKDSSFEKEKKIENDEVFSSSVQKNKNENVQNEAGREKGGMVGEKGVFFELRMRLMLRLLIHGGIKMEELHNVRLCDIVLSDGGRYVHVRVSRPRRGERILPLSPAHLWAQFLAYRDLCTGEFLCSTFEGRLMHRREIEIGIAHFFDKHHLTYIGIQGFRHSYAKRLVDAEYSKERMRYLLGYRNTTSVAKYIEIFKKSA